MYQIRKCREMRGLTQNYVALSLGVKPPSVNGWESGKTKPTIDNLIALSELLCVSTDMLLGIETVSVQPCDTSKIDGLSAHEHDLIVAYRKQPGSVQDAICDILHIEHPSISKAN